MSLQLFELVPTTPSREAAETLIAQVSQAVEAAGASVLESQVTASHERIFTIVELGSDDVAGLTEAERAEYNRAAIETEARLQLAELVYNARAAAGISQTELARRAGTRQSVISAIENGAQAPGGVMLARIAHALGGTLGIHVAA